MNLVRSVRQQAEFDVEAVLSIADSNSGFVSDYGLKPLPARRSSSKIGFTLIELMIVVAIMAIVMTMSIPLLYKSTRREALNKAVRDMVEVCSQARAMAILQGKMTELVWHPREMRCEVAGVPRLKAADDAPFGESTPPPLNSGLAAQISDKLTIEMLDVNLTEYKDAEYARVRFYPNGTSDEFTLILHSERGDWIKIWLEITTGVANVGAVNQ